VIIIHFATQISRPSRLAPFWLNIYDEFYSRKDSDYFIITTKAAAASHIMKMAWN